MSEYIKIDACDLDRLIEQTYGKRFGIPMWMEGQRLVEVSVSYSENEEEWVDKMLTAWKQSPHDLYSWTDDPTVGYPPVIEIVLGDLCRQGLLEEGEYLVEFDD